MNGSATIRDYVAALYEAEKADKEGNDIEELGKKIRELAERMNRAAEMEDDTIDFSGDEIVLMEGATAISDGSYDEFLMTFSIQKRATDILNQKKKIEEAVRNTLSEPDTESIHRWVQFLSVIELSDDLLSYFTLSSEIISHFTVSALINEIIDEEYKSSDATREFLSEYITQPQREELLLRCGVIDEPLFGQMKQVREYRNNLVHDLRIRMELPNTPEKFDIVWVIVNIVDELQDISS